MAQDQNLLKHDDRKVRIKAAHKTFEDIRGSRKVDDESLPKGGHFWVSKLQLVEGVFLTRAQASETVLKHFENTLKSSKYFHVMLVDYVPAVLVGTYKRGVASCYVVYVDHEFSVNEQKLIKSAVGESLVNLLVEKGTHSAKSQLIEMAVKKALGREIPGIGDFVLAQAETVFKQADAADAAVMESKAAFQLFATDLGTELGGPVGGFLAGEVAGAVFDFVFHKKK